MRKPRILASAGKEGKYSICARANLGEFILQTAAIKDMFLEILQEARDRKKYRFGVLNFCIMDNHIHLILRVDPGESLSRIMQWLLSVFAMRFNDIFERKGHVWYDRFKSALIEAQKHMMDVFMYVINNPVKAKMATKASEYKYSGIACIQRNDFSLVEKPPGYLMEVVQSLI